MTVFHSMNYCFLLTGSLKENIDIEESVVNTTIGSVSEQLLKLPYDNVQKDLLYISSSFLTFIAPFSHCSFDDDELRYVRLSYAKFLPDINILEVPQLYEKYHTIKIYGDRYTSIRVKSERSCYIQAYWVKERGIIDDTCSKIGFGVIEFSSTKMLILEEFTRLFLWQK